MKIFSWAVTVTALFIFTSCSFIIDSFIGDQSYDVINLGQKNFALVFSHNIHGETHPCGCRHFPLGGLPQVAGLFEEIKKDHELLYVDTGDTLFDSVNISESTKQSSIFKAESLARGLSDVGLRYWTPGDFDLANGLGFIKETVTKRRFELLVANFKNGIDIPHKEFVIIAKGPHRLFLTGMIHPDVIYNGEDRKSFLSPKQFMPALLKKIKERGYDANNPFHRLVLLSHSGREKDDVIAKDYPDFDWIIGAHTQSFYKNPQIEGKTKIVQVLSRNHYVGQITFDMTKDKSADTYQIHEIRDELKDKLKPNPFLAFIDQHKTKAREIQIKEQEESMPSTGQRKIATAASCIECHDKQGDFWRGTSHSLAYATLLKAKEETNLSCVKCHSVGEGKPSGFLKVSDIVHIEEKSVEADKLDAHKKAYFAEVKNAFAPIKSVRDLSTKQREINTEKWAQIDKKYNVTHNYANVQCLNCHDQGGEHPFAMNSEKKPQGERYQAITNKCLTCHNSDQSPEWYVKKENGLPGDLDQKAFKQKVKQMSCPKGLD